MFMVTSQAIRKIREKFDESPTQFGVRCGVSANTIHCWESGRRFPKRTTQEKLNDLAKQVGVDLSTNGHAANGSRKGK